MRVAGSVYLGCGFTSTGTVALQALTPIES
jgi:hypothetical protein